MSSYSRASILKKGWDTALRHPFLLILLFLYHFAWGFMLYRSISAIVTPLLHRYPGGILSDSEVQLFFAEAQFRMLKTDLTHPYLWLLLVLLLMRMACTPLLNAGIFYSLHNTQYHAGYRFVKGVKELGGPFLLYYVLQMLITLVPLYWIVPKTVVFIQQLHTYDAIAFKLLPYVLGFLVYGYMIHLCFTYVQLAKTIENKPWKAAFFLIRYLLPIVTVTTILLLLSGLITAVAVSTSLIWAGFLALVLYQVYRLAHIFCKIWFVSTQYQLWMEKI